MGFLSRALDWIGGVPKAQGSISYGSRAYDAGRPDSRELGGWNPGLAHPDNEVLASRDRITARARHLDRNHPIVSGAVDRREEMVMGPNIRLEATPDFEAMGRTVDWAEDWSAGVEARFRVWGRDSGLFCDVERKQMFGMQMATAYRHWWVDGEACAAIYDLPRGGTHATSVKLIDPDRLSNPDNLPDNWKLPNGNKVVGGVELDADGAHVAYHVRVAHPAATGPEVNLWRWERVPRWGPTGRPRFVHAYKANRAEQRRAVSRMVSLIRKTRMFDQFDDATLENALFTAVNGFWVESPYPTRDVAEAMAPDGGSDEADGWSLEKQIEYREQNKVSLAGGVRVFHGLPGEKVGAINVDRPSSTYPDFQATGLRAISAALGLHYPMVAQNYADINYSSGKLQGNDIWRGLLHDRWLFTQLFGAPIYAAWLEEDVLLGNTKIPGGWPNFYRNRAALTMCEYKGPGRGKVEPLKESAADDLDQAAGRTNLSVICEDLGHDPRQIMLGQVRDRKMREKLGLPEPVYGKAGATQQAEDDEEEERAAEERRETGEAA